MEPNREVDVRRDENPTRTVPGNVPFPPTLSSRRLAALEQSRRGRTVERQLMRELLVRR